MPPQNVDVVFVVDASASMQPCFEGLVKNIVEFVRPLQTGSTRMRFGLVAHSAGKNQTGTGRVFNISFLCGNWQTVYSQDSSGLFTEDREMFVQTLSGIVPTGDEHSLLGLDFALDFPFGRLSDTRRVISVFSDEKIEDGAITPDELAKIPNLIEKIQARRVKLFATLPRSPAAEQLSEIGGSEFEEVNGGDGLKSVDFKKLLSQMGKSVSIFSLQATSEPPYQKAIFGQDKWVIGSGSFDGLR